MQITFYCSLQQLILMALSIWKGDDFLHRVSFCLSVVSLVASATALKIALRICSNGSLSKWIRVNSGATAAFALASMLQSNSVILLEGMEESSLPFRVSFRSIMTLSTLFGSAHIALKCCNIMELASKKSKELRQHNNLPPEILRKLNEMDQLIGRPHTD
jgi:hypothetical protein